MAIFFPFEKCVYIMYLFILKKKRTEHGVEPNKILCKLEDDFS